MLNSGCIWSQALELDIAFAVIFEWGLYTRVPKSLDQLGAMVEGMEGKRLRYRELIAPNGLPSGARGA